MARYPFPPTPDGWYALCQSAELATGELRPLSYFGRELVAFRGADGAARAFDAHCPHLGAHQDVPIWEHKAWHAKPRLTAMDGPVARYRAWFAQF